jgi:nitrate reductase NapD
MHISSLIVDARAQDAAALRDTLSHWPGVEVHALTDTGRLVVTLDTDTAAQTQELFSRIGTEPGVMSLALVYHHHETETELEA